MDLIQYPPNKKQQANGYKTTKIKQARDRQRLQQVTNQSTRFTGAEENMLNIHELSGKSIINQHKMILSKEKKQKNFQSLYEYQKMELERERDRRNGKLGGGGGGKDTNTYPHKEKVMK